MAQRCQHGMVVSYCCYGAAIGNNANASFAIRAMCDVVLAYRWVAGSSQADTDTVSVRKTIRPATSTQGYRICVDIGAVGQARKIHDRNGIFSDLSHRIVIVDLRIAVVVLEKHKAIHRIIYCVVRHVRRMTARNAVA